VARAERARSVRQAVGDATPQVVGFVDADVDALRSQRSSGMARIASEPHPALAKARCQGGMKLGYAAPFEACGGSRVPRHARAKQLTQLSQPGRLRGMARHLKAEARDIGLEWVRGTGVALSQDQVRFVPGAPIRHIVEDVGLAG